MRHFSMAPFPLLGSVMSEGQEFENFIKVQWCLQLTAPKLKTD